MSPGAPASPLVATSLTVEGLVHCLTAPATPRFAWLLDAGPSADAGQSFQGAYRLKVMDRTGTEVWDSGTVVSDRQHCFPSAGPEQSAKPGPSQKSSLGPRLDPDSDYHWTVQLTDSTGAVGEPSPPALFSTGLFEADASWAAEWIHRKAGGRAPLELMDGFLRVSGSPHLPWPVSTGDSTVITARFRLRLGTAGILLRSDGPGTGLLLEINPNRTALLRLAPDWQIGAMSAPATEPLAETPAFAATAASRAGAIPQDGWQDLVITDDGQRITVTIDGITAVEADVAITGSQGVAFHQGPRSQAEYLSLSVEEGGKTLLSSDFSTPGALINWTPTTSLRQPDEWTLAKTAMKLKGTVARARLYAAASHHAAFSLNGSPCLETTNFGYPGEHFYNTADVTGLLQFTDTATLTAVAHWYGPGQGRAAGRPGLLVQMTVDYDDGTRDVFGSGPGWLVAEAPYRQGGYRNDEGDPIEYFDATAWPAPDDWHPALSLGAHPVPDFPGLSPNHAGIARKHAPAVEIFTAADGTPVADFGTVIPGRPVVEFPSGTHGRTVMLRAGYNLLANGRIDAGKTASQNTDMAFPYTQKDGPQRYEAAVHLGFRYLELPGVDRGDLGAVGATIIHAEHPAEGSFNSSDETLNRVFTLLRDSALFGVQEQFVDTPTREKGQFLGDAVNISYATMALFGERHFTAKALREFAGSAKRYWDSPQERGRYNAVYPNGDGKRDIPDFSLMMPEWVEDYHRLSGDDALVQELLPCLQDTAEYVLRHIPGSGPTAGLVTDLGGGAGPYLHGIVDWPAPGRFGYDMDCGARTTVNAQSWSVLDVVSRLCGAAGLAPEAARFGQAAASLAGNITSKLRVDGVMVDGLYADGRPSLTASQHATSFPLSLGITPSGHAAKDAERLAGMGMRQGPMTVHRLFRALLSQGRVDDVLDLLTDPGQPGWARLLEAGGSFTWEAWELDEGTDYSQSHAWSASVVREILEHLLGVRVTAPGASAVVIQPPVCRLERAAGSVPTQRGVVAVSWQRTVDGMELECSIPAGVTAQVVLPDRTVSAAPGRWTFGPRDGS
ncbi:alpha-L-rhamnosidase [Paenarthrobacter nitroguajacolicus]|uniref:family 78 glycoside hydrolase catalytic domain n=1 Tax=Paenarthrobacter nitroguajacolicus TaxID=211146 RepID=UPI00285A25C4|nr:family 78 glycoside hydrolase catalytic domain [Paenarthrobacter nitroguajacolicus]MDR6988067.1 alpha-L-rhamnosidase [Paenarthrobacter nitroguajacolicus]